MKANAPAKQTRGVIQGGNQRYYTVTLLRFTPKKDTFTQSSCVMMPRCCNSAASMRCALRIASAVLIRVFQPCLHSFSQCTTLSTLVICASAQSRLSDSASATQNTSASTVQTPREQPIPTAPRQHSLHDCVSDAAHTHLWVCLRLVFARHHSMPFYFCILYRTLFNSRVSTENLHVINSAVWPSLAPQCADARNMPMSRTGSATRSAREGCWPNSSQVRHTDALDLPNLSIKLMQLQ